MSQFADYSAIDPMLNAWGERNELHWITCYKDYDVRSYSWPLAGNESVQIWVDPPSGDGIVVNVALNSSLDARRTTKKAKCSFETLEAALDEVLRVAREWKNANAAN